MKKTILSIILLTLLIVGLVSATTENTTTNKGSICKTSSITKMQNVLEKSNIKTQISNTPLNKMLLITNFCK